MAKGIDFFLTHARELEKKYAGKCIAVVDDKVVAVGTNRLEVYKASIKKFPRIRKWAYSTFH